MNETIKNSIADSFTKPLHSLLERFKLSCSSVKVYFRARYRKLEPREKSLLIVACLLAFVLAVWNLVIIPARDISDKLDQEVVQRRRELVQATHLVEQYRRLSHEVLIARRRAQLAGKDFALFPVLERSLSKTIKREKITSITPSERAAGPALIEHRVEVQMEDLSLAEIVDALYTIEHLTPQVSVTDLRIKKNANNSHAFSVNMTCVAVGKAG